VPFLKKIYLFLLSFSPTTVFPIFGGVVELASLGTQSKLGSVVPVDIKGWTTPSAVDAFLVFLELELFCAKLFSSFFLNQFLSFLLFDSLNDLFSKKSMNVILSFHSSIV